VVRDFLLRTDGSARDAASRVELAADILGKAQQTINTLPGTINSLALEVAQLSGQLTNLADVTRAVGELRFSLDGMRTSLVQFSPLPQAPPTAGPTGIFKVFRKRRRSSGN
jgi:hypothetical protein